MNTAYLRNGLKTGSTFAVLVVFFALIGFIGTGAALISKLLGNQVVQGALPDVGMGYAFMGLLGFLAGVAAARPCEHDTYLGAAISGLAAGIIAGLISAIFGYIVGTLYADGADMRKYLAELSPEDVKFFLFNLSPVSGSLALLGVLSGTGLAGGLLARIFRSEGRRSFSQNISNRVSAFRGQANAKKVLGSRWARYALLGLVLVVLAVLPSQWGTYWNYVMGTVGIYVVLGLGLNIIVGLAGQLVLGYVAFFAIGAYAIALLNAPVPLHIMVGFWIALVGAILISAIAGILVGLPILSLRGDYLAIVTLGLGEIIRILLRSDSLTSLTGGPQGVPNIAPPVIFGTTFSSDSDFMYLILLAVLLTIFITQRVQNSRTGRAWISIREDEIVSKATGVETFRSKLLALALGAAFAGIGGALFAVRNQFTGPEDHSLMVSINVLALVIVGGMGSIPGIILGSFVLKGLPEILRELDNYRLLAFGALLVVMMIIRPEGIWPAKRPRLENAEKEVENVPLEEYDLSRKPENLPSVKGGK